MLNAIARQRIHQRLGLQFSKELLKKTQFASYGASTQYQHVAATTASTIPFALRNSGSMQRTNVVLYSTTTITRNNNDKNNEIRPSRKTVATTPFNIGLTSFNKLRVFTNSLIQMQARTYTTEPGQDEAVPTKRKKRTRGKKVEEDSAASAIESEYNARAITDADFGAVAPVKEKKKRGPKKATQSADEAEPKARKPRKPREPKPREPKQPKEEATPQEIPIIKKESKREREAREAREREAAELTALFEAVLNKNAPRATTTEIPADAATATATATATTTTDAATTHETEVNPTAAAEATTTTTTTVDTTGAIPGSNRKLSPTEKFEKLFGPIAPASSETREQMIDDLFFKYFSSQKSNRRIVDLGEADEDDLFAQLFGGGKKVQQTRSVDLFTQVFGPQEETFKPKEATVFQSSSVQQRRHAQQQQQQSRHYPRGKRHLNEEKQVDDIFNRLFSDAPKKAPSTQAPNTNAGFEQSTAAQQRAEPSIPRQKQHDTAPDYDAETEELFNSLFGQAPKKPPQQQH